MEYTGQCGCKLKQLGHVITAIEYCPLHKSAPDLYEALKELVKVVDDDSYDIDSFTTQPAKRALAKVEGK